MSVKEDLSSKLSSKCPICYNRDGTPKASAVNMQEKIIAILIKHECLTRLDDRKYKTIANEIEALFKNEKKL